MNADGFPDLLVLNYGPNVLYRNNGDGTFTDVSNAAGFAAAWTSPAAPISQRLGYTTTNGVYLPAEQANGLTVAIDSGSVTAYAGDPQAPQVRQGRPVGRRELERLDLPDALAE